MSKPFFFLLLPILLIHQFSWAQTTKRPNIVFILTDQERYFADYPAELEVPGRRWLMDRGVRVIRALRVKGPETIAEAARYPDCTILLDAFVKGAMGGTGKTFDWELARDLAASRPVILSGGLKPENVAEAIRQVRPYGVDTSSGVEGDTPGRKDFDRVRAFIENARSSE